MNRRQALTVAVSLLCSHIIAEESKQDDFKTDIVGLPPCDRVEIIRLGTSAGKYVPIEGRTDGALRLVLPDDTSNLYHVEPYNEWWTVLARKTIKGPEAERIASYLRAFQPRISEHIDSNGRRSVFSGPSCHTPPFAYNFYAGDKLLYDTSVCWGCENLIVGPVGKRYYFYFKTGTKESKDLLEASKKLFPEHPLK